MKGWNIDEKDYDLLLPSFVFPDFVLLLGRELKFKKTTDTKREKDMKDF